jgi:hypothetical protein
MNSPAISLGTALRKIVADRVSPVSIRLFAAGRQSISFENRYLMLRQNLAPQKNVPLNFISVQSSVSTRTG